jgi:hypothetical protein
MPTFPWPAHGDIPPAGDPAYDAMLARTLPPGETPAGLGSVAEAFAALNAAPAHSGPAAEADALAVFRSTVGVPAEPTRPRRRRHPVLTSLLSAKLAAAAAVAAVTLGGAAAAAYSGRLPAPVQKIAHDTIGAPKTPDAHSTSRATPQPTPAGLPGHAAYGLCTAYAHQKAHGTASQKAAAFHKLAAAAGGAAHVTAYCAGVAHPGSPSPRTPATHPAGQPSTLPSHPQPTHPAGKPTSPPSHVPATHPVGKPTSTS